MSFGVLKTELQSRGVRLPDVPLEGRRGGAGPAEGITLTLNGTVMTVPAYSPYAQESPYRICMQGSLFYLYCRDDLIAPIHIVNNSSFYHGVTSDGQPYAKIALVHGLDCMASTVIQSCHFWGGPLGCRFCAIGLSLSRGLTTRIKTPQQLVEVALAAKDKGISHVLLTSGSSSNGNYEIKHLAACTRAIKQATGLPVQVQCRPPRDLAVLNLLKEAGADSLGVHIESLDDEVLKHVAPFKAWIGWAGYRKAWSKAVDLFGRGQVVTFIIMGLGERLSLTYTRLFELADLGVYPFIVPLRPVPGTPMAGALPPPPVLMKQIYEQAAGILSLYGLFSREIKAGCGRCSACSALPDFEEGN